MSNKLELTWYGKEKKLKIEPRLLIENKELSNTEFDADTENMLIHGDNLLALKALESKYAGKVKCIYIDPPYNTGAAFEHYDDNVEHSIWLNLMKARLEILKRLMSDEASIWIQIDDEEQAYLKVLCDEVFGRKNFINMISVNMKNVAGASGGGEDKRLKKNCEYILGYAKNYDKLPVFTGVYSYTEMSDLIQKYIDEGKSWKYTTVLINPGEKVFYGTTIDGDGNEIKIYLRKNPIMMSIKQVAKKDGISEKEAYKKYGTKVFRTTNAQSSIRARILEFRKTENISDSILSIEYVPRSGKNKGSIYEQFYKDDACNLFVWLKDTSEVIDGVLYKKDLQGTYWDMNAWMKNVTREGSVTFPNGKKPEQIIKQIIGMTTDENDIVLDSFLGSGTTSATAHKMNRRWIGIEMGQQAYTHCKVRLDKVISGEDSGGITKSVNWQGGGGYKFYELAPSLINIDIFDEPVINKEYSADMLASAVALHEGFNYQPSEDVFWKQSVGNENSYLFVTTRHLTSQYIDSIKDAMADNEYLIIACRSFDAGLEKEYKQITVKKIPNMLLADCEFDKDNYNLNIINPPMYDDFEEDEADE
ncbi:site-specific DNA-methyltransferase [Clostridioides sp. ZZV14-6150]|uniref:site-specific DNA-methyltransferase n=1 Tax=unclassified Clostridioides TaxID=2635829 RepID=UPI001D127ACF|nr:site-specific DNA-methyltransferase [Clostridioides sp. ZZV14-6150]MCC0724652.1 site-specific DNA-methyltransferase [Clostridioides sp. ZZV14-6104]MCC0733507.1 site-specific DNA-methyltransferase [Clostridioides sp. ZZV14-6009]MCC0750159.1 site-specific DNA-methyltransferase [Clostridioides sp. ZZV13-5731]